MSPKQQPLVFLLDLNLRLAARELASQTVQAPGLPAIVKDPAPFISTDRLEAPGGPAIVPAVKHKKDA
jgi:hypothetical protein